ncbi:efflux RND transporter periplasmic adaptor subunit [Alteromonas pelagimontana]|uniref:Efflux RND transporter periplasmic adaptor subunit n=1 Tax=Alteromonas pelagimontana TaxID=1858656 RepID=A0A6M4MB07_9ALTE|nr:efflux RND transporter periplasmic adaptor subunit [Alteromonas pelagimontana]QJR80179.1 efflux RND transporter periplasmic adaptor subunit [Alteromonas pelagimontana]
MRISLLIPVIFILIACSKPQPPEPLHRSVVSVDVAPYDGKSQHILSGITQPAETSQLSFEISGIVKTVNVNLGDTFVEGDVLATIDPKIFALNVKQRKGQLSEVNARLREAKADFERKEQLIATGAVSQAVLDVATTQLQSLNDQVDIAQAQLELAEEDLADTKLVAPYAGTIAERHIEPSQRVTPAEPAFSIQGTGGIEVSVLAPENLISQLHPGDQVDVTVFALKEAPIPGKVFEVGSQAQSANAFPVTVRLNDGYSTLQPGMSAEVKFTFDTATVATNTFVVPLSALGAADKNQHFVWKIVSNSDNHTHTVTRQLVTLLSLNQDTALIQGNLTADLPVVRSGVEFLKEGEAVNLTSDKPRLFNE